MLRSRRHRGSLVRLLLKDKKEGQEKHQTWGCGICSPNWKHTLQTQHTGPSQHARQLQFGFQVHTTEPRNADASCDCSFLGLRIMFGLKVCALCCSAGTTKSCLGLQSGTVPQGDPQQKQDTDVYIVGPKTL